MLVAAAPGPPRPSPAPARRPDPANVSARRSGLLLLLLRLLRPCCNPPPPAAAAAADAANLPLLGLLLLPSTHAYTWEERPSLGSVLVSRRAAVSTATDGEWGVPSEVARQLATRRPLVAHGDVTVTSLHRSPAILTTAAQQLTRGSVSAGMPAGALSCGGHAAAIITCLVHGLRQPPAPAAAQPLPAAAQTLPGSPLFTTHRRRTQAP